MTDAAAFGRRIFSAGAAATLATPFIWRRAQAADRLVIRTPGGVYDDVMRRAIYDPFTRATGIEIVPSASPMSKLIAMYKAGGAEYDVIDTGDTALLNLARIGALADVDYKSWKYTDLGDILKEVVFPTRIGTYTYATVLGYDATTFADKHPRNWIEFWDTKAFPGPRSMPDMASGQPPLEFALIADGVPIDKLYPMDIPRAFRALTRIRGSVPKFWDTGALSAQMMSDKEIVLNAVWNGRIQTLIDKGAKLGIEWNQNMIQVQAFGIPKTTRNMAAAQLFVDFACQPSLQTGYAKDLRYGPVNQKTYPLLDKELVATLPGGPAYREMGFFMDITFWEDNRDKINRAWSAWALG